MRYLIYHSTALVEEGSEASRRILRSSLRNNEAQAITGFLHREDDIFLQYIEGPAAAIEALWTLLCTDRRHTGVTLVTRRLLLMRRFSTWTMGYTSRDSISFREYLEAESGKTDLGAVTADEALVFLRDACQVVDRSVHL